MSHPKNETILLEVNLRKSKVQVPKKLNHQEVVNKIPEHWLFKDIIEEEKIYNTQVRERIQEENDIRLRMNRSISTKIFEPQNLYGEGPSRHSIDGSTLRFDPKGLDNIVPRISIPVYHETNKLESPPYSPTTSQIINTLTR